MSKYDEFIPLMRSTLSKVKKMRIILQKTTEIIDFDQKINFHA